MSLFLGKIHYWLFNKILWFENIEDCVIELAIKEGMNTENIKNEIEYKYGKKLLNKNLEEIIDLENIHGWLQNRIHTSEARLAAWIKIILQNDLDAKEKLEKIFQKQGILAAREAKNGIEYTSAIDIYNSMNNYILDGMPCDRVNVISVSEENLVSWKRRICVHEKILSNEGVDVRFFYNLRNVWIENFVMELNNSFKYLEQPLGDFKIIKL